MSLWALPPRVSPTREDGLGTRVKRYPRIKPTNKGIQKKDLGVKRYLLKELETGDFKQPHSPQAVTPKNQKTNGKQKKNPSSTLSFPHFIFTF
jgi:hypothetical protein